MEEENCEEIYQKYTKLLSSKSDSETLDIDLEDLGCLVENFENFFSSQPNTSYSKSDVVKKLVEEITPFGLVPSFNGPEDRDFDIRDFPYTADNAEKCFKYLRILLNKFEHFDNAAKRHFIIHVFLLSATHNRIYIWSSDKSIAASKALLNELLISTKQKDILSLLCGDVFHPTIFKGILKHMRPFLLKDTWMKNPSSCHMFYWILSQVKHPYMADYLDDVFPPPFMFTSYYGIHQQVLGIRSFDHIIYNVPPSLIKLNGKEDAIYHALAPLIYSKEHPIVEVLYPCLLKLPMMKQKKLNRIYWIQYDHVLHHLLLNLEMEGSAMLRRTYLSHVNSYIESIPPFKHMRRIFKVLDRNFLIYDGPEESCRILSLKIMKTVIKLCWPRMENYCLEILKIILKLIYNLEEREDNLNEYVSDEIYNLCEECLYLLRNACYEKFQNLAKDYVEEGSNMPGIKILNSALNKQ